MTIILTSPTGSDEAQAARRVNFSLSVSEVDISMLTYTRTEWWPYLRTHWRALLLLLLGVLLPLALFAHLVHEVFQEGGFAWDQAVLRWYAQHRTPTLTQAAKGLEVLGGLAVLPFMVLGAALVLRQAGAKVQGWFLITSMVGALLLNVITKVVFQRSRPDELVSVLRESGFSFPSGHAMTNAAFAAALILIFWRSRGGWPVAVAGIAWALLIGISRNYLGVHYPSDVLAAFTAGIAWVAGLYLLMGRRWPELCSAPAAPVQTFPPVSILPAHAEDPGAPD